MKKIIALLLALAMCVSLCACGKSEAVTNVEGLIDAIGVVNAESERAITAAEEAYNALTEEEKAEVENYAVLTAAKDSLMKAKILGEWVVLGESSTFIFNEDGSYTYKYDNQNINGNYIFTDKGVEFTLEVVFRLEYQEKDGIEYLTANNFGLEFVKAKYATTKEYEININNWQDYFTIREQTLIDKNGFGEIQNIQVYQVLELKEEYRNRLAGIGNYERDKYSIAVESKFTRKAVSCELNGEEISYTERTDWSPEDYTEIIDIRQMDMCWYYNVNNTSNDAYNIAVAGGYGWSSGDKIGVFLVEDLEISRIQGTLLLYDLPISNTMAKDTDSMVFTNSQSYEALALPPVPEAAPEAPAAPGA